VNFSFCALTITPAPETKNPSSFAVTQKDGSREPSL
jgi:hypothetical protein